MKARNLIQICLLCAAMLQALTSGAQPVTQISAGSMHSLFLKSDGSMWGMGLATEGQLAGGADWIPEPIYITNYYNSITVSNAIAIAAGLQHTLLIKNDGSLWGVGNNFWGELGNGIYNTAVPFGTNNLQKIEASNVTAIAAGYEHSLFLKSDGSLWAMGANSNVGGNHSGQLGDGTFNNVDQPEMIVSGNITAIAAGGYHSLFIKSDGSLWVMGDDTYGQLGDGTYKKSITIYGTNKPEMIVASGVTAIAGGGSHSLFIKSDGSLWAMGYNGAGELGDGTYNNNNRPEQIVASNVTAIAAGFEHSLFLKSDGSLWVMGYNGYGELGDGTGNINTNRPEMIVSSGVMAIAAGQFHSLFIKSDGSLWAMGQDEYWQLGDGNISLNSTNLPEQILGPYNQISGQLLGGTNMLLSFVGIANANYALDYSTSLSQPNWIPQLTNPASSFGPLVFNNPPDATTNNFWRIRSVP